MAQQRYRVLERIDAGGMAEVFRGVATSIEGFSKTVAIKRVLPSLTRKRRFVRMFLDEARLSLGLNHANIVQVFDLGTADETYFIVMEYVEGTNLRTVLEDLFEQRRPMAVAEAVYVMAEVCKGLGYAHQLKDQNGRALEIVHRDVSPPNILLSRQGEVKITDFGLAKARSQLEKTDPGIVKGKFGYLSPEAAYGEPIDQRTDLFAVGVVLWELLAGQRLFQAATESKTLDLVRKARVPDLVAINPSVPAELDHIVRSALMRDRNARLSDAGELARHLTGFLFDHNLKVGAFDIARLVDDTMAGPAAREPHRDGAVTDRAIEAMIQAEIEHFVSLDEGEAAAGGGPLEDPSTWFDVDEDDDGGGHEAPGKGAKELKGLRVGPQVTTISTAIPIQVMEEAIAAREGGLDWELRKGGAPRVEPRAEPPGEAPSGSGSSVSADDDDDAFDPGSSISMAIPIDIVEDAPTPEDEAARLARTLDAAERLGRRGDDTDAWADLEHLEDDEPDPLEILAFDRGPSQALPVRGEPVDDALKLSHLDAAEVGLTDPIAGSRTRAPTSADVARAEDAAASGPPEPEPASAAEPAPGAARRVSQAMIAVVDRVEHVLRPRQLVPPGQTRRSRRGLARALIAFAILAVVTAIVAAVIFALWRL